MKTDCELLELAARAAGIEVDAVVNDGVPNRFGGGYWNPLTDDGDALRLAVKLRILVDVTRFATTAIANGDIHAAEKHNGDPYVATRRAIVRAAAAIGEGMK